jgi:hypothetical protein
MQLLKSSRRLQYSADFYGSDSNELFQKNLKEKPPDWRWRIVPIRYNVNSQGYRCDEFDNIDWSNSILIIGDSIVFGLGLDVASTAASKLSLLTNSSVVNLGQPGASPMFSWANSCILRDNNITPQGVIYLWTFAERVTEFLPNNLDSTAINHSPHFNNNWATNWISHPDQGFEFMKYAIISTSNMWNCPVLHYSTTYDQTDGRYNQLKNVKFLSKPRDWARDWISNEDLAHPGPNWNKVWANSIVNDLVSLTRPRYYHI